MKITTFFKNLLYLIKMDFKDIARCFKENGPVSHKELVAIMENLKYELYDDLKNLKTPKIKSVEETLEDLITKKASICRFGDGELRLMDGQDIIFQKASPKLTERLNEVLSSDLDNLFVGIPRVIYSSKDNIADISKKFWRVHGSEFREKLEKYINFEKQYYSAEISIVYSLFKNYDLNKYFEDIKKLWQNRDVAIICGNSVFDKIENNIFDSANSVEYIYAPSKDAFTHYDEILLNAKQIDKNKVVVIILGPTAKILAYDLAKEGYQALDLGHIAKSYDWYLKNKTTLNMKDAVDFFNPD